MLIFEYICGLQLCDNMTWSCLVPRPLFIAEWNGTHKNKQTDYFPHRKAEVSLVTAAASWRHISSFGNFHWAGSQNRREILVLGFRNTRHSYKYWYLVRYLCCVQHHVTTVTQGASRRLFAYVQSGCVTCSDDVGQPQASNILLIINIYLLQLGCYPVAVVILHVYKTWNWLLLNLSREGYMRNM